MSQAACSGIARIGKAFLALRVLLLVQAFKVGTQHQHFAAHFDKCRHTRAFQPQRNAADGADIGGNLFTAITVATRGCLTQHAIDVNQADCQPIKLRANLIFNHITRHHLAHTAVKRLDIFVAESVIQRQHGCTVAERLEFRQRCAAHPLRRRIGRQQLGVLLLKPLKLGKQAVVFGIGDLRIVEDVIAVVVILKLLAQRRCASNQVSVGHQANSLSASGLPGSMPRSCMRL